MERRSHVRVASVGKKLTIYRVLVVTAAWFLFTLYFLASCKPDMYHHPAELFKQPPSAIKTTSVIAGDSNANDPCLVEYHRVTASRTAGLTADDLERSRAYTGNRQRLATVAHKLIEQQKPLHIIVCGGSISMGHGVTPENARYSDRLHEWLEQYYPLPADQNQQHLVTSMAAHGADMCAMAKRMNLLDLKMPPDLFVLEFGVNDYQGQDHKVHLDHKSNVFFDGFQRLAGCAETVVHKLLSDYPDAAVLFLEFQTAILNRKTAQLLHMGVAQHYQVPVISYADALWPDFYRLMETLRPTDFSLPPPSAAVGVKASDNRDLSVFPYPHGCAPCQPEHIVPGFREKGCKSVCVFAKRSGYYNGECDVRGDPCYVPFFAHDAVHPSAVGHQIARDLIVEALLSAYLKECGGEKFTEHLLPQHSGWLAAGPQYHDELRARSDFVLVQDTMHIFGKQYPLESKVHTEGFALKGDQLADRKGWIATNPAGGESISFDIDLPVGECYAVFLSVLKSYETVGSFTVTVIDTIKQTTTQPQTFDCVWEPHISIPADVQVTKDEPPECTGKCKVTVTTNAEIPGRGGNQIKIMSLSARKCTKGKKK